MGIHEDAQDGTLVGPRLTRYLIANPNILSVQNLATGRAPLATAAVAGQTDVVELLLNKGAKAEERSRDGETALLLTILETESPKRPRIVQLLLNKAPEVVDETTTARGNKSPLVYAVEKKDLESIRLLVQAGAERTAAEAAAGSDRAVKRALDPEERQKNAKLTDLVGDFLLFIIAVVNETADNVVKNLSGLAGAMNDSFDKEVNYEETPNKVEFLENIDVFLAKEENEPLAQFFKEDPSFIQDLAKNATELANDPTTTLGGSDLLPKVFKVSLHKQVIYCDDSASMQRDNRWADQAELVKRITRITTRILPDGDGVALRFINQDLTVMNLGDVDTLDNQGIARAMNGLQWQPRGDTPIGTSLKSKILEPMIYSQLLSKTLARPYLISVMTDGMPSREKDETFVEAIKECGDKLQEANYPRESVKFLIGQIGSGKSVAKFLDGVGKIPSIEKAVHVTSDQLDAKFSDYKAKEADLDRWLLETLFEPIRKYKPT
ncbi:hypothetical protein D9619_008712 [Psilocybe cf. subviscida]|uniref:VWFA domain-containing protein n=1 Tax=Psilocybe cf. subviscida TaxID=2480587 RepID=A0A8H5BAF1_9AGAR|nr:hypothetical protein D9619_008712 [Psilocybe cf. subviscida]